MKPARIFLYIVAALIVLVVGALVALRLFSAELTRVAFVPDAPFAAQAPLAADAYADPKMWLSKPGMGLAGPARWQPAYAEGTTPPAAAAVDDEPRYAVFFIHPTSYLDKARWNAALDDPATNARTQLFVKAMASPFNHANEIWIPRYRQAAIGAFITDDARADKAIDTAYRDVEQAFAHFLAQVPPDEPIVLAAHSQGSLHLLRLLATRIAGTPVAGRIAAAYAVGWPVSVEHDLPKLGLPPCGSADQAGCLVSWVSFAEPADPGQMLTRYDGSPGLDGRPRAGSPILCVNPLTGSQGGAAPATANRGTLVPNAQVNDGLLVPGTVPARCVPSGLLLIGDPPQLGPGVLPGNNYHVYDVPLFWANLQADVEHRIRIWAKAH